MKYFDELQEDLRDWGIRCFGQEHMDDAQLRGLRLLEEAIEFGQAVGVPLEQAKRLIDYVYSRPVGDPAQELGGVAVTMMVAAASLKLKASDVLEQETVRVLSKPPEHFAARNQAKLDAGFK